MRRNKTCVYFRLHYSLYLHTRRSGCLCILGLSECNSPQHSGFTVCKITRLRRVTARVKKPLTASASCASVGARFALTVHQSLGGNLTSGRQFEDQLPGWICHPRRLVRSVLRQTIGGRHTPACWYNICRSVAVPCFIRTAVVLRT